MNIETADEAAHRLANEHKEACRVIEGPDGHQYALCPNIYRRYGIPAGYKLLYMVSPDEQNREAE